MGHPRLAPLAAHVFVDDLDAPVLCDDDAHHLMRVLRLRDGEAVSVSDGAGRWRSCVVRSGMVEATGPVEQATAPDPRVGVGFALTKGDKPELTVQKLTELGVDRIIPVRATRSVVQWDSAKAERNLARLRAVARAAAMQARRVWLPEVTDIREIESLQEPGLAFAHPGGGRLSSDLHTVLVGPEGGWTDAELDGRALVDLGSTTLRAETAALSAGALLVALRDGRVR